MISYQLRDPEPFYVFVMKWGNLRKDICCAADYFEE